MKLWHWVAPWDRLAWPKVPSLVVASTIGLTEAAYTVAPDVAFPGSKPWVANTTAGLAHTAAITSRKRLCLPVLAHIGRRPHAHDSCRSGTLGPDLCLAGLKLQQLDEGGTVLNSASIQECRLGRNPCVVKQSSENCGGPGASLGGALRLACLQAKQSHPEYAQDLPGFVRSTKSQSLTV